MSPFAFSDVGQVALSEEKAPPSVDKGSCIVAHFILCSSIDLRTHDFVHAENCDCAQEAYHSWVSIIKSPRW